MKVYRALPPAVATFYEKQSDVPRGIKFETVEFPFNASPKGDFVAWLNVATQPPVAVIEDDCDGADWVGSIGSRYPRLVRLYPHIFGATA